MDGLQDSLWEDLVERVGVGLGDEGGLLAGLEDDAVAGDEGGQDHPLRHEQREVPGRDRGDDAERVVAELGDRALGGEFARGDGLGDLVGLGEEFFADVGDLADAVGEGLALLEGEELAEFVGAVEDRLAGGLDDVGPGLGGQGAPGLLGLACAGDDGGDVGSGGDGDLAYDLAVERVERGEGGLCIGDDGHGNAPSKVRAEADSMPRTKGIRAGFVCLL